MRLGLDYIKFQQLIDLILNVHKDNKADKEHCLRQVCEWKICSADSLPLALLYYYLDDFVLEYLGHYSHCLNRDLFLYSLHHGNRLFLQ